MLVFHPACAVARVFLIFYVTTTPFNTAVAHGDIALYGLETRGGGGGCQGGAGWNFTFFMHMLVPSFEEKKM